MHLGHVQVQEVLILVILMAYRAVRVIRVLLLVVVKFVWGREALVAFAAVEVALVVPDVLVVHLLGQEGGGARFAVIVLAVISFREMVAQVRLVREVNVAGMAVHMKRMIVVMQLQGRLVLEIALALLTVVMSHTILPERGIRVVSSQVICVEE
ncbi:hypothetical protein F4781DRAFT_367284 [Annulohypoxylon bovei var. microspora]|nr:hypothetical protein F4781DRAFT_367284 [Annulohypoxylon bovei var. microspora]